jgi:putative spermidine/putrescine transport system ATP-binding protein
MSDPAFLSLKKLTLAYGDTVAVKDLDLSIRKGELVAFLGPSGCGKTTTMRSIAGLLKPQSGRISLDGADITRVAANRRSVGLVFQSYALFPHLSVFENVAFGLRLKGLSGAELESRVGTGLKSVGLTSFADRKPAELFRRSAAARSTCPLDGDGAEGASSRRAAFQPRRASEARDAHGTTAGPEGNRRHHDLRHP